MNISFVMYKGSHIFSSSMLADHVPPFGVDDNDAFGLLPVSRTCLESACDESLTDTVEASDNDRYRIFWTGADFERTRSLAHAAAQLWRTIVTKDTANRNARLRPIIVNIQSTTIGVFVSKRNSEWHFEVCIVEVRYEPYAEMTEEGRRDDGGDQEEQDHDITKNDTDSDAQSNIDDSEMTDDEESDDSEGASTEHDAEDHEISGGDRGEGPDDREEASSEEVTEYWGTNVEGARDGTATYEEPASGNEEEPSTGYNETIEKAGDEEGGSLDAYEERRARGDNATIRDATSENYSERPELWQFSNIGGEFGGCYSKTWSFAN
ncbi:hypothetical protein BDN71DRAFT_1430802 [Pleurotus eryngii]|uniref:Uncharacterized protein n=1 Tax=Pleurotus eryngii TaxID=5323 RepID=A0A9P5ZWI1_PLEER|nr:hypothetical protein BDN71DRAFT_1430802 [Pleurotus eryngii]